MIFVFTDDYMQQLKTSRKLDMSLGKRDTILLLIRRTIWSLYLPIYWHFLLCHRFGRINLHLTHAYTFFSPDDYIVLNNIPKVATNNNSVQSESGLSKFDRYRNQDDDMDEGKWVCSFELYSWIDWIFNWQMTPCRSWSRTHPRRCRRSKNRCANGWVIVVRCAKASTPATWSCTGRSGPILRQRPACNNDWARLMSIQPLPSAIESPCTRSTHSPKMVRMLWSATTCRARFCSMRSERLSQMRQLQLRRQCQRKSTTWRCRKKSRTFK